VLGIIFLLGASDFECFFIDSQYALVDSFTHKRDLFISCKYFHHQIKFLAFQVPNFGSFLFNLAFVCFNLRFEF